MKALHGTVIHSANASTLEVLTNALLVISEAGLIQLLQPDIPPDQVTSILASNYQTTNIPVKYLTPTQFIIPGFVDTHNHAPQWPQRGLGRGLSLLDWLERVTFKHEARFADPDYAVNMYGKCVNGMLKQGITTAAYYGSLHGEASRVLGRVCVERGQRALVGRCNMTREAPGWYCENGNTEEVLQETRQFMKDMQVVEGESGGLVRAVLTPRFAISCHEEILRGLGDMAKCEFPDSPIQTHFNEAVDEITYTKKLFPHYRTETQLYESFGLLTDRTILAHAIYLEPDEFTRLQTLNCGIAHCPIANTTIGPFMIAPVREYLRRGMKVGLGTDSGGGYSSSMLEVMKMAFVVSNAQFTTTGGRDEVLSIEEGFYLATMGGASVCGFQDRVGNFATGKEFDALLVDTAVDEVMAPVEEEDGVRVMLEKFLMTGDDRNIVQVFVRGRVVKDMLD